MENGFLSPGLHWLRQHTAATLGQEIHVVSLKVFAYGIVGIVVFYCMVKPKAFSRGLNIF